jgi:hypothetical protein
LWHLQEHLEDPWDPYFQLSLYLLWVQWHLYWWHLQEHLAGPWVLCFQYIRYRLLLQFVLPYQEHLEDPWVLYDQWDLWLLYLLLFQVLLESQSAQYGLWVLLHL